MDVEMRIAAGNRVNGALAVMMRWQNGTFGRTQCSVGVPALLYGSDTWVLQKKNERKLNAVEMLSLRKICGVSVAD